MIGRWGYFKAQGSNSFIIGLYYETREVKLLLFLTYIVTKKPLSAFS
jgi:hypothetical protein